MKRRHQRIAFVLFALCSLSIAAALVLKAFNRNLVFYFTPSQVAAKQAPVSRDFRLGGLVVQGSLRRDADGLTTRFTVTDTLRNIPVVYRGILPDLFKEGRGCVAQGKIGADGTFYAEQVLAKHDENYMPPGTK
jgi:cytochrome c-type biogenesis protein CcmE